MSFEFGHGNPSKLVKKLLKESKDLFGNLVPDLIYDFPKDRPKIIEY